MQKYYDCTHAGKDSNISDPFIPISSNFARLSQKNPGPGVLNKHATGKKSTHLNNSAKMDKINV